MEEFAGGAQAAHERGAPPLDWEQQPSSSYQQTAMAPGMGMGQQGGGGGHHNPQQGGGFPGGGGYAQAVMGPGGGPGGGMAMGQRSSSGPPLGGGGMGGYHGGGMVEPLPPPPRPPPGMAPGQPGPGGGWVGGGGGGGGGGGVLPPHPPPQYNNGGLGSGASHHITDGGRSVTTLVASVNQSQHRISNNVRQEIRRLSDGYDIESLLTIFAGCAAAVVEGHNVGDPLVGELVETCLDDFHHVVDQTRQKLRAKRQKR